MSRKKRREVSLEMMEALEARNEKEKARLAAKSRQHKKEIDKEWVYVWQGGAPQ